MKITFSYYVFLSAKNEEKLMYKVCEHYGDGCVKWERDSETN